MFCREGLQYKHNKNTLVILYRQGIGLLIREQRAAHQKFLNEPVKGFKTFVIYSDGGDSNTVEKH